METLRTIVGGFFCEDKAPAGNNNGAARAEPNTMDVVDLMQQRQELQHLQEQQEQKKRPRLFELTTADQPVESNTAEVQPSYVKKHIAKVDYQMEFIEFINHNAPQGFAPKFQNMLPYLEVSFLAWPSYWLWRGFHWQSKRRTERLGLYINRTFQHAKLMQVAILGFGLLMANSAVASSQPLDVHDVSYRSNQKANNKEQAVPQAFHSK